MSPSKIINRVIARTTADTIHPLAVEEALGFDSDQTLAFWIRLLYGVMRMLPEEHLPVRTIERGPLAPMTNEEATAFGKTVICFGKYMGDPVNEVPLDYLDWLNGEPDFRQQLRRYMANETISRLVQETVA